jgi:predicted metal-dependent phosphoesterase TrpH
MGHDAATTGAFRADYHVHTCYSYDCETSLSDVLDRARARGLDRIAITDHGTIEGALRLAEQCSDELEVIIGCELETDEGCQVIGLGLQAVPTETRLLELLDHIRATGGTVLLPHPFRRGSGVFASGRRRSPRSVAEVLARTDLVECFNGRDGYDDNAASRRFVSERGLAGSVGSDAHTPSEVGSAYLEIGAGDPLAGETRRRVFHPGQAPRHERALKRRLMEAYHRVEPRLPGQVALGYRRVRRAARLDQARTGPATPRFQYELPAAVSNSDGLP